MKKIYIHVLLLLIPASGVIHGMERDIDEPENEREKLLPTTKPTTKIGLYGTNASSIQEEYHKPKKSRFTFRGKSEKPLEGDTSLEIDTVYKSIPPITKKTLSSIDLDKALASVMSYEKNSPAYNYAVKKLNKWIKKGNLGSQAATEYNKCISSYIKEDSLPSNKKTIFLMENWKIDVNTRYQGQPLLTIAAAAGNKKIMRYLLDNNAKIDTVDTFGQTPLLVAILNNKIQVAFDLINADAELNRSGIPPLTMAIDAGSVLLVEHLIKKGAKIEDYHLNIAKEQRAKAKKAKEDFKESSLKEIVDILNKHHKSDLSESE